MHRAKSARLLLAGGTEDALHQTARSEETSLQIVVRIPPGFSKLPQFGELTEAGIHRSKTMSRVPSVLANHIHKAAQPPQEVRMLIALGQ